MNDSLKNRLFFTALTSLCGRFKKSNVLFVAEKWPKSSRARCIGSCQRFTGTRGNGANYARRSAAPEGASVASKKLERTVHRELPKVHRDENKNLWGLAGNFTSTNSVNIFSRIVSLCFVVLVQ